MPYKVTGFLKRKPGMTFEEFDEYWGKNHAAIFSNLKAVRENIVQYNQFHILPKAHESIKKLGVPIAEYDGMTELFVENLDDLEKLFADGEFQEKVTKDEFNFLDRESTVLLVGVNQVKMQKE